MGKVDCHTFDAFQTELKNVLETLKYAERKFELKKRLDEDFSYQQLEEDTLELIEVLTNVKIQRIKEEEEQSIMYSFPGTGTIREHYKLKWNFCTTKFHFEKREVEFRITFNTSEKVIKEKLNFL